MKSNLLILQVLLFLGACSTMNSEFSCDKTAGDQCLTIEEVHEMTEKNPPQVSKTVNSNSLSTNRVPIWMAPQRDDVIGKSFT